jgi:hypothetical protein
MSSKQQQELVTSSPGWACLCKGLTLLVCVCGCVLQLPSVDEISAHMGGNKLTTIIFFLDETFEEVSATATVLQQRRHSGQTQYPPGSACLFGCEFGHPQVTAVASCMFCGFGVSSSA